MKAKLKPLSEILTSEAHFFGTKGEIVLTGKPTAISIAPENFKNFGTSIEVEYYTPGFFRRNEAIYLAEWFDPPIPKEEFPESKEEMIQEIKKLREELKALKDELVHSDIYRVNNKDVEGCTCPKFYKAGVPFAGVSYGCPHHGR